MLPADAMPRFSLMPDTLLPPYAAPLFVMLMLLSIAAVITLLPALYCLLMPTSRSRRYARYYY